MLATWKTRYEDVRPRLRKAGLIAAGIVALYISAVRPTPNAREIENQRQTGLAAWNPAPRWRQSRLEHFLNANADKSQAIAGTELAAASFTGDSTAFMLADNRKLVTASAIALIVRNPGNAVETIRDLALKHGGFPVTSEVSGSTGNTTASIVVRVPVARFEEVRKQIRELGLRVESDRLNSQDVTRDYVDRDARLRNLTAQEQQYLQILKRATSVKDTLEVSEKLNDVRGQIEQQQAEFNALVKQIETIEIAVSLMNDGETQVLGIHWRPLYRLKLALRDGLEGLGDYVASMAAFVFLLPTILLWLATIIAGASITWRLLRWLARVFFHYPKTEKAVN
jgi:hypothetical protein